MTDVTTEVETTDVVPAADAPPVPAPEAEVPFWQRPNIERYFMPLFVPIAVVLGIVIFVLNISRVFLAGSGAIPTVVGTIVLLAILLGATVLANASLKTTSIALITTGFVFVVFVSGWLVLGASAEKHEANAALPATGPVNGTIKIVSAPTGGLTYAPSAITVKTGVYEIILTNNANAQHTLDFTDSTTMFPGMVVNKAGEVLKGRIFFGTPEAYKFFCAIPGHEAAGMKGVVTVTGDPITLEEAEAAGKPSST